MTIERWTSLFAQPIIHHKTVAVDKRIEVLLQEILSRPPEHPERKVIVLPPEGKAKCIELTEFKIMGFFLFNQSCTLLQSSELVIKSYLEGNKTHLKTVDSFARQKGGILDTFLEKERQEGIKKNLGGGNRIELISLVSKAFSFSESLEFDLWAIDQIHRLGLMRDLLEILPVDKIQKAVRDLARQLNSQDFFTRSEDIYPSFFKGMANWLIEPTAPGRSEIAVERIITAWLFDSDKLDLQCCGLDQLPSQIGQLTQLRGLFLGHNKLESLSPQIGQLTQLTDLSLDHNRLVTLPPEIGQLAHLDHIYLHRNKLESLPPQMGQLLSLRGFMISRNPKLCDLPMSLGNIPELTFIDRNGTRISASTVLAIHIQCRAMRDREAAVILPIRLEKWKTIAKSSVDLTGIESFEDSQKITLNEWLVRLEKTSDFAKSQSALAEIVCQMLVDVIENREFKELFFVQAEANNECCQDRAAMSLNEIYTSWNILCKSADLSLLTGVAKTLCLRKELQKIIPKNERESVEIFLYYETALSQRLHLVTAIKSMTFITIGMRNWIDENRLIDNVEANFFEELFELPIFQKVLSEDSSIQAQMEVIDSTFLEQLVNLGECPKGAEDNPLVFEFNHKQGEVMQQQRMAKVKLAKAWYKANVEPKHKDKRNILN